MFKDQGQSEFHENAIYRIKSGGSVFSKPVYAEYIEALHKVVNVKRDVFDALYVRLLHSYAQYTQSLLVPRDKSGDYLLDRSLRRAYGFAKYCAPKVMKNNGYGFDPDRLMYALFSCALLTGIGRVFQDRQLDVCEKSGQFIKTHYPTMGFISGEYYRVRAMNSQDEEYVELMHAIYAQQVMPSMGLAWIAEEQKLFCWWIAALADINKGFSDLEIDLDIEKHAKGVGEDLNFEKEVVQHEPVETMEGEAFLAWLKEQLARDSSLVQKDGSGLHHVDGALLVELDKLVEQYVNDERFGRVSASDVTKQFMLLGVAGAGASYSISKSAGFLGGVTKQEFEAVAISHEKALFETASLGPVTQVASSAQISSGERFFSRIGGLAQQFMLGQTSQK